MKFVGAIEFLTKLRANNNKEWFEAHRDEYERLILNPSKDFVIEMGEHLQALVPSISFEPKLNKSLFKIYRDTRRMGSNKEPMKSKIGIIFPQGGYNRRLQKSSFYMHFSPDELFVAAGIRWFESDSLQKYRDFISEAKNRDRLEAIIENLVNSGYKIIGKELKRYPRGFNDSMGELGLYKAMAASISLDVKIIEDTDLLIDTLFYHYEKMLPFQQIVYEMMID